MTHRAPGPMPKVGADAGPRASAAEGRAARRLIAGLLLAAAALDLARCGLVMATARHPAPAAGLITAGLAAAVLSSWTARGHLRGRRWPAWAAVLIGTASAPQAAAAGFGAPYTIPDTATAVLGILLAVTVLATVGGSRPGQHTENPCAVNRECHRPGAQPPASRRNPGRMADPGGRRQVLPAPAEGRLLPQSRLGTLPPDRPPAVPGHPARPPGPEQPAPAVHLRRGTRRQRPVPVPLPRRQPPPAEQLRPPRVPARLRRAMRAGRPAAAPDRHRRRHHLTRRPARHLACRHTGRRGPEQSGGLRSPRPRGAGHARPLYPRLGPDARDPGQGPSGPLGGLAQGPGGDPPHSPVPLLDELLASHRRHQADAGPAIGTVRHLATRTTPGRQGEVDLPDSSQTA